MVRGPQAERLTTAVTGAQAETVSAAAREWVRCAGVLEQVGQYLSNASSTVKWAIGGETGPAVDAAFRRSSEAMSAKALVLGDGATALADASAAIETAKTAEATLRDMAPPTAYRAPLGNPTEDELHQQAQSKSREQQFASDLAAQEEKARAHADKLDAEFAKATATMKKIHGEPDPPPPPPPPAGAPGGVSNGSSTGPTGHIITTPGSHATGGGHVVVDTGFAHPTHGPSVDYVPNHETRGPAGSDGASSGPGGLSGGGGLSGAGGHIGGSTPSLGTPVGGSEVGGSGPSGSDSGYGLSAGATAGGMAAGVIGGRLAGAIKGGLFPSAAGASGTAGVRGTAGRGTAASAVRGIGTSARSGAAGTLGRGVPAAGSGTAGRAGAGGAGSAGKSAASPGRSGAGGAGRSGSGGRAGAGGRGGSGARSGAGPNGRAGRSKDDKDGKKRELFDVGEDWVDDEGAAPGVLD